MNASENASSTSNRLHLRILHVISTIHPSAGGPSTVITRIAAAQAALGHEVNILSYLGPDERDVVEQSIRSIPGITGVHFDFISQASPLDKFFNWSAKPYLRRLVASADVVHLHGVWEPILYMAASLAHQHNIPYIVRPAGMLDTWSLQQHWLKKQIALTLGYRRMLHQAAFIHTLNRDERDLIKLLQLRSALEVIPNGVFLEEVHPLPPQGTFLNAHPELQGKPYILFLSRLHYKKGLDYLADAFQIVAQHHPDVHLVVAGPDDGAAKPFLEKIQQANITHRTHLVGPQYAQNKLAALRDATIFCLPSRQEGFSLAVTEALACGTPAVISDACHFPEVAEAHAGEVLPLNPAAFAESLLRLLSNQNLRSTMSANGIKLVTDHYTWPSIAQKTVAAYLSHGVIPRHR